MVYQIQISFLTKTFSSAVCLYFWLNTSDFELVSMATLALVQINTAASPSCECYSGLLVLCSVSENNQTLQ